jgi:hypothetical protein
MATVAGGLFHPTSAAPTHVTATVRPDAGFLSLGSVTGGIGSGGSGTDTVVGPQGDPRFAGNLPSSTEQVVATTTQVGGDTVVSLTDGSTLIFVGMTKPDAIIH